MPLNLSLATDCQVSSQCAPLAAGLYGTLTRGNYTWPASILDLSSMDEYLAEHRTARKRAARSRRRGYMFGPFERSDYVDDIHSINLSAPERQGKPMSKGYVDRPSFEPLPDYPCARHAIRTYGVFRAAGRRLVAYLVLYLCGDIALVSQILGHDAYLADDIMYLLVVEALADTLERSGPTVVFYNRHDSGTDGLRFFKERLGFRPERVEWLR